MYHGSFHLVVSVNRFTAYIVLILLILSDVNLHLAVVVVLVLVVVFLLLCLTYVLASFLFMRNCSFCDYH
jgi:cell division protein FtsW (lipid II flippase)